MPWGRKEGGGAIAKAMIKNNPEKQKNMSYIYICKRASLSPSYVSVKD
jgi:hypothetical protein